MTKRLAEAFAEAAKLPDDQQEAIAVLLMEEIASERRWDEAFAKSQDQLSKLADQALAEFEQGKTIPFEKDSDLAHD
jgi:hypothetical protein